MQKLGFLIALAVSSLMAACTAPSDQFTSKDDLLALAGFSFIPATTPARQQQMYSMTPHHFYRRVEGQKVVYLYADPWICNCLYVGTPIAYDNYR
jgi:hypothetical protein